MQLPAWLLRDEEELAKRDDDHKPSDHPPLLPLPASWRVPMRVRRKRVGIVLLAVVVLYIFFKNMPTDVPPMSQRIDVRLTDGKGQTNSGALQRQDSGPLPNGAVGADSEHYFNGPIQFLKLAGSLRGISRTMGTQVHNRNVLFAAGSLRSASLLIPIACEMARWRRSYIHLAFMGREDVALNEILELNGVGIECDVYWHDARPDRSAISTDFRMEVSISAALGHIETYMHPQVILVDNSGYEDLYMTKAITAKAKEIFKPVIELPADAAEKFLWLTRLDSASLNAWHKMNIEILVHAPQHSSGGLIRLLKSLEQADYVGSQPPRLTIELPPSIDYETASYLQGFMWPPVKSGPYYQSSQVSVRHRISRPNISPDEASARFLESFYPTNTQYSHVLVLSPQTELSPLYFQYLKYTLLEYRASNYAVRDSKKIFGISLESPSLYLNGSGPFEPPLTEPKTPEEGESEVTPYLWQAPNTNAALYFGDKWAEFHSFLTHRLKATVSQTSNPRKAVLDRHHPSWAEDLLELMRARDYSLVYPNFESGEAIATVHNEIYNPPEESADDETIDEDRPIYAESPLATNSLLSLLPFDSDLPELTNMPVLSYDGRKLTQKETISESAEYVLYFRETVGKCKGTLMEAPRPMSASDLFCLDLEAGAEVPVAPPEPKPAPPTPPAAPAVREVKKNLAEGSKLNNTGFEQFLAAEKDAAERSKAASGPDISGPDAT